MIDQKLTAAESYELLTCMDAKVKTVLRWIEDARRMAEERERRERLIRQAVEQWELMERMARELNDPACPLSRKR